MVLWCPSMDIRTHRAEVMVTPEISDQWTDEERLKVIIMIAMEMFVCRDRRSWVNIEQVIEWSERILFLTHMPAQWLETNRRKMLNGFELRVD